MMKINMMVWWRWVVKSPWKMRPVLLDSLLRKSFLCLLLPVVFIHLPKRLWAPWRWSYLIFSSSQLCRFMKWSWHWINWTKPSPGKSIHKVIDSQTLMFRKDSMSSSNAHPMVHFNVHHLS
jgi:hypothetical protein